MKALLFSLIFFCFSVNAEVLLGVNYRATLGEVKKLYPNASFANLKPAWLQADQAFVRISGAGMSGELRVAFYDARPYWASYSREDAVATYSRIYAVVTDDMIDQHLRWTKAQAAKADDDALSVSWVRWVPQSPIPLSKVVGRYGKPHCTVDEVFDNVCRWSNRSLSATMDDSGKNVQFFETDFTEAEKKKGMGIN